MLDLQKYYLCCNDVNINKQCDYMLYNVICYIKVKCGDHMNINPQ